MGAVAKKHRQATFLELATDHGYARRAIASIANKPIVAQNAAHEEVDKRFTQFFDNYYMQFLALQLERFHFDLNRPFLPAQELNRADSLIEGKLGNATLDTPHLIGLLSQTVELIMEQHATQPLTWDTFFHHTYNAHDGSIIRGQDIIRGLIKSDLMQSGADFESYHHHYRGKEFATLSMMQVMAEELEQLQPTNLTYINRFGQELQLKHVEQAKALAPRVSRLRQPRLDDFLSLNTHENIKQCIGDIFKNLLGPQDLKLLHEQRIQLTCFNFNPGMYTRDWQNFLQELDSALQLIATPYA